MADREKLIELLDDFPVQMEWHDNEELADHLIANGVTMLEHGEWVVCGDGEYVPFMCSACGKTTSWYHKQTARYCPNCGAKMDLKEETK